MIKTINVKNFQSHANTEIELDPMVNTIIGLSDSGKSGLIRAIKANLQRAPFYLKIGEMSGEVGIGFSDYSICRKMDASKVRKCPSCKADVTEDGSYLCKCGQYIEPSTKSDFYIGEKNELYEKFGINLPDYILDKTKIRPISFVDFEEDLNISNQHDDMFFVGKSYSGLRRNKILSSLIPDSEKIDILIKTMNSELSKDKQIFEIAQNNNAEIAPKIEKATPLIEEYKILLIEIKSIENYLLEIAGQMEMLSNASEFFKQNASKFAIITKLEPLKKYISSMNSDVESIGVLLSTTTAIEQSKKFFDDNKSRFNIKVDEIDLPITAEIENIDASIGILESFKFSINKIMIDSTSTNNAIIKANDELNSLTKRFDEFIDKEAICPIIKDRYCDKCKLIIKE